MPSFTKKVYINKKDGGTLVPNEPIIVPSNTTDIVYLEHDNAHDITCFSGMNSSGTPLTGDITVVNHPTLTWKQGLQFSTSAVTSFSGQTVYTNYVTDGDMVEVDVINRLEEQVEFLTNTGGGSGLAVQVVSTSPTDNALDADVNSNIDVTLNKWIDDEQVGYLDSLKVYSDSGRTTEILGVVTQLNKKTLRFNPNNNLDFTALVYPRLLAGLVAVDGMTLADNYDFSFQTASAPPNDSPVITYFDIKTGTMLTTGVTLEWDYTDTESNPITSIEIYEDGVLHGTMTSAGTKNGNNRYEIVISATPNYGYNELHNYYIKIKDDYNTWTTSLTVSGTTPINQAPTTPTITASIDSNGNIYNFRVTNQPITDNETDSMTATVFVDGVALTGYINVPFTSSTWSTNTSLGTNYTNGTTHSIYIEIYDGYNTVPSNTVPGLLVQSNQPPTASPTISGTTTVGSTLTVNVNYFDAESDPAGTHTYQWYYCTTADIATRVAISGATSASYLIPELYVGKYLACGVTPKATSGTLTGVETFSSTLLIPVPAPPSLNTPTVGNAQNTISFTANSTLTTETYNLYWLIDAGTPTADTVKSTGIQITGITSPYTHSSLTNGSKYNYVLTMVVNGVESSPSAVVSGTPISTPNFDFNGAADSAIDPYFTVMTAGSGTARINGSGQLELTSNAIADGELVFRTNAVTLTAVKTYKRKFKVQQSSPAYTSSVALAIYDNATKFSPTVAASVPLNLFGINFQDISGVLKLVGAYRDGSDIGYNWNTQNKTWTDPSQWLTLSYDTYYTIILETTATQWRITLKNADETTVVEQFPWMNWAATKSVIGSAWLAFGDVWTDYHTGKTLTDQFTEV